MCTVSRAAGQAKGKNKRDGTSERLERRKRQKYLLLEPKGCFLRFMSTYYIYISHKAFKNIRIILDDTYIYGCNI